MHLCKHRYNIYTDIKIEAYNIGLYQSTDIHFHACHNILLPIRIHSLRDQKLYRETDIYIDMYICARTCICRNKYRYLYRDMQTHVDNLFGVSTISLPNCSGGHIPHTICRQCIRIYVYAYVSTQNKRYAHVQNVSYTNILYRERNKPMYPYTCL